MVNLIGCGFVRNRIGSLNLCTCVCVCVCVCVYNVHVYIYIYIYVCMHACMHVCMYVYTHTHTCICTYVYARTHAHTHTMNTHRWCRPAMRKHATDTVRLAHRLDGWQSPLVHILKSQCPSIFTIERPYRAYLWECGPRVIPVLLRSRSSVIPPKARCFVTSPLNITFIRQEHHIH